MFECMRKEEVLSELDTDKKLGLSQDEVKLRSQRIGKNRLIEAKKENIFIRFLKQFNDFMIMILIGASVVSAGISYIQGENDYIGEILYGISETTYLYEKQIFILCICCIACCLQC